MNHPDIEKLEQFVAALYEAAEEFPETDMSSINPPACNTPGCHAGLAAVALDRLGVPAPEIYPRYSFIKEATLLTRFLFDDTTLDEEALEEWAAENPNLWGNEDGAGMFWDGTAFGQASRCFPSRIIAEHWNGVLRRLKEYADCVRAVA